MKLKDCAVGQRVAVYVNVNWQSRRVGTIKELENHTLPQGQVWVSFEEIFPYVPPFNNVTGLAVYPQQCRKLVPKKKREPRVWWVLSSDCLGMKPLDPDGWVKVMEVVE